MQASNDSFDRLLGIWREAQPPILCELVEYFGQFFLLKIRKGKYVIGWEPSYQPGIRVEEAPHPGRIACQNDHQARTLVFKTGK